MASDEPVLCLINAVLGQVDAVLFGNPAWVLAWPGAGFDFHLSGHPLRARGFVPNPEILGPN